MGEGSVTQSRYFNAIASRDAWKEVAMRLYGLDRSWPDELSMEMLEIEELITRAERITLGHER